jgi:spermidine synthase
MMYFRARSGVLLLFFCSGAAGLGYQMVWVRMFAAGLGHETPAMLAVAGAFLAGMAVGAWFLDRRISRSAYPARWYGGLELAIGSWGALTVLFIPIVNLLALKLTGPSPSPLQQWLIVFALPFVTLLPATAAMGATLPAMERFLAPFTEDGRCIGALYASNTFGAVAGVLGSVFVLMPLLGFRLSLICLAVLNLFCGVIALASNSFVAADGVRPSPGAEGWAAAKYSRAQLTGHDSAPGDGHTPGITSATPFWRIGLTVFFTGLLGIGFELAGVRVLAQVLENTIYTFAAVLSVYLMGTAAGASLYQRLVSRRAFDRTLAFLLCGLATACLLGTGLLSFSPVVYRHTRGWFGDSIPGVLASEMIVAAMAFGPATLFMGATFTHLVQAARTSVGGVGRAGALNTLGCALASVVVGVWLVPALGTKWTLTLLALGYLPMVPRFRAVFGVIPLLLGALAFSLSVNLKIVDLPPDGTVLAYREGVMASVAVVRTVDGHRSLRVNNRLQMGGTAAALAERRQAHIPLLLHPHPRSALFLGPGTGITLGAAGAHPGLRTEGVELVTEVRDMMRYFEPENEGLLTNPVIRVHTADARRFVRTTLDRYDLIVADLFHPAQDGAGFLYTREHFQAIRERLAPGGLFCQWLPLHQLDEAVLRSIVRTFIETFSEARGFLLHFNVDIPALALIGTPDPIHLPTDWFEQRLADPELRSHLRGVGLERPLNLLGCFAASPGALSRFIGDAPLSTDNHPVVLFAAPRFTVRRDAAPHELLLTFLERCRAERKELSAVLPGSDQFLGANLGDFIAARDLYLKGLVEEAAGRLPVAIDAYLESARCSLHFTASYARVTMIIQFMAKTDQDQARKLFQRLEQAQPAQPLGRQMFGPLFEQRPVKE